MAERDFQTKSLHFHYNTLLPQELRLWTTGEKERWEYRDLAALRDYLEVVLGIMRNQEILDAYQAAQRPRTLEE